MLKLKMTPRAKETILTAVTVLACVWACRDLLVSWRLDPNAKGSALVFIGWAGLSAYQIARRSQVPTANPTGVAFAAFLFMCGLVADLSVVSHLALAVAVASFLEGWIPRCGCIILALSWFPALGWLCDHFLDLRIEYLRGILALAFAIPSFWLCRPHKKLYPAASTVS